MTEIHPTAIVSPQAILADDVFIGPHVVIDGAVQLGRGCRLHSQCFIGGPATIGEGNEFYPFSAVGLRSVDRKADGDGGGLKIGNNNIFREHASIHRSTSPDCQTEIGDENLFMGVSHVGHDSTVYNRTTIGHYSGLAGHVHMHDYAILSGSTVVHQGCRVGPYSFIGMGGILLNDLPPWSLATGNPARLRGLNLIGLQRAGFSAEDIKNMKNALQIVYSPKGSLEERTQQIEELSVGSVVLTNLVEFIRQSNRGLVRKDGK